MASKQTVLFVVLDLYADWEAAYLSSAVLNLGQGKYAVKTILLTKNRFIRWAVLRCCRTMICNLYRKILRD